MNNFPSTLYTQSYVYTTYLENENENIQTEMKCEKLVSQHSSVKIVGNPHFKRELIK